LSGYEKPSLVKVTNYMARIVYGFNRGGAVHRDVEQEQPIAVGKVDAPLGGAIKLMDLAVPNNPWHQDSDQGAANAAMQSPGRPRGDLEQLWCGAPHHVSKLVNLFCFGPLMVDLRNCSRVRCLEKRTLAASSNFSAK
jgi:hypothetical protein